MTHDETGSLLSYAPTVWGRGDGSRRCSSPWWTRCERSMCEHGVSHGCRCRPLNVGASTSPSSCVSARTSATTGGATRRSRGSAFSIYSWSVTTICPRSAIRSHDAPRSRWSSTPRSPPGPMSDAATSLSRASRATSRPRTERQNAIGMPSLSSFRANPSGLPTVWQNVPSARA